MYCNNLPFLKKIFKYKENRLLILNIALGWRWVVSWPLCQMGKLHEARGKNALIILISVIYYLLISHHSTIYIVGGSDCVVK